MRVTDHIFLNGGGAVGGFDGRTQGGGRAGVSFAW